MDKGNEQENKHQIDNMNNIGNVSLLNKDDVFDATAKVKNCKDGNVTSLQCECDAKQLKFCIAIDFGTDGSVLAYTDQQKIYIHDKFESVRYGTTVKPKTIILLNEDGDYEAFGMEAKLTFMSFKSKSDIDRFLLFDRFKMALYEDHDSNVEMKTNIADELTAFNGKKYRSEKVFIEAFKYLHNEAILWLENKGMNLYKKEEIQWIITIPAIWNDEAKRKMNEWIIKAGIVDKSIRNHCKIVSEPHCASLSIQHDNNINFEKGDKYILVDAGGGTVDIVCHQVMDSSMIKDILPPSGGKWGSCYIDDEYIKLLQTLIGKEWMDEFKEEDPNIYVEILHNFQQCKSTFFIDRNKETHNVSLPSDFCGFLEEKFEEESDDEYDDIDDKINEMKIYGKSEMIEKDEEMLEINKLIWQKMFDHVINPTIDHIKKLLNEAIMKNCKYLCVVGGLSSSPYFQYKMKMQFGQKSQYKLNVIIPNKPILSVVQGAAYYGMTKSNIKTSSIN